MCLRYGPVVKLLEVFKNDDGSIKYATVELLPNYTEKLKGYIHWVSKDHSMTVTANLYSALFLIEDINKAKDKWLDYINPESLVVCNNAKMWKMHKNAKVDDRFQFERSGYFVVDETSDLKKGKIILNRIVELKESKDKVVKL